MQTLTIQDETATGTPINEFQIQLSAEEVTLKEIIEERVKAEVEAYNQKPAEFFRGLIQPSAAEKTLNGFKMKSRKAIDSEKQTYVALDAFLKNGFFVLIDDLQAESLEQRVRITDRTRVSFIKLTPLVGG